MTYVVIIVAVLVIISTYTLGTLRTYLLEQQKLEVLTRANVIASVVDEKFDEANIEKMMATMPLELGFRAMVLDRQSRVYYDSFTEGSFRGKIYIYTPVTEVLQSGKDSASFFEKDNVWSVEAAVPIVRNTKTIGAVLVTANGDTISEVVDHIFKAILVFGLVLLAFVLILGTTMASIITHPIEKLTGFIRNMPKDRLQKCEIKSRDEIGDLGIAFNELIDRVAELEEKRRAFVSDASHELKTPLSIIKLLSDSLLATENPDPEFLKEFLTDMNDEVERLTRIVQRLLDLTKMDQSFTNMNVEVCSITVLTEEVCEKLQPLAENKDIEFVFHKLDDELSMSADRDRMTEAIYNILDNSIKYTEPGGTVKVELMRDLGNIIVRISDTGIGIPKDEIQKIFDRFYRVDKARARDTGGTGLGLSIAMDVIKLHDGYIEVSSEEEVGSTFTIVLPCEITPVAKSLPEETVESLPAVPTLDTPDEVIGKPSDETLVPSEKPQESNTIYDYLRDENENIE